MNKKNKEDKIKPTPETKDKVGIHGQTRVGIYSRKEDEFLLEEVEYFTTTEEAAAFCDKTNVEGQKHFAFIEGQVV